MSKKILFVLVFAFQFMSSQNTVGTISVKEDAFDGYTLFTSSAKSYLINNCGQVINKWESSFPPGNAVYLLPNGNLLRAGRDDGKSDIVFGGQGGIVELFNWEGEIIWSYSFNNNQERQHHDIYPMPNGNILVLIAESWSKDDAILNGRDPSKITKERLYNEKIIEVKPIGNNDIEIVWEWNINDHLVQDFDDTKLNYGNVALSPEKLDVNFLNGGNGSENWLHVNSIQYDEKLDQIVISSRNLSEFWVIDHSTSIEESSSDSGGLYGKGGDLLYRWGNPQSYRQGSEEDRVLFGQHTPHFIGQGLENEGDIILFNNGIERDPDYSEVYILSPPFADGAYIYEENTAFLPQEPFYNYNTLSSNSTSDFYSHIVSNAQVLPNGNILICEGSVGNFFEINSEKEIVWNYVNPVSNIGGEILSQGDEAASNTTFRAIKYAKDYDAFQGKKIEIQDPIELNFNLNPCNSLSVKNNSLENEISIYPNPSNDIFNLNIIVDTVVVFNNFGKQIISIKKTNKIDLNNYASGIYFVKINLESNIIVKKIIKN